MQSTGPRCVPLLLKQANVHMGIQPEGMILAGCGSLVCGQREPRCVCLPSRSAGTRSQSAGVLGRQGSACFHPCEHSVFASEVGEVGVVATALRNAQVWSVCPL